MSLLSVPGLIQPEEKFSNKQLKEGIHPSKLFYIIRRPTLKFFYVQSYLFYYHLHEFTIHVCLIVSSFISLYIMDLNEHVRLGRLLTSVLV